MKDTWRRFGPEALVLVAALAYRLWLTRAFYGWEESDYGNLAMARGVLDSHFTHFDMRHLPLFYGLSAAVMGIVGDAVWATHIVSLSSGMGLIAVVMVLGRQLFDRPVSLVAAGLLVFQPEVALYSSSSLREPLYTLLVLSGISLGLRGRFLGGTAAVGGAFLTRFDALFTTIPVLAFHALSRPGPRRRRAADLARVALVAALFVGGWSTYCGLVHGDFIFFRQTIEVNVATGGAQEIRTRWDFIRQGLEVDLALFTQIMPRKMGWAVWGGCLAAVVLLSRRAWRQADLRTFLLAWLTTSGFWFAVAFFAQHEPNHNLYWKWMYVLVPFWCLLAAWSWVGLIRRLPAGPATLAALLGLALTGTAFARETRDQLAASERLYKPQVDLARWIEDEVPMGTAMILDNIPACWINRRAHGYELYSWFDLELIPGDPEDLARLIEREDLRYVMWFKEDWTQAPRLAPYLAEVEAHTVGPYILQPLRWEMEYGFIFYEVRRAPGL